MKRPPIILAVLFLLMVAGTGLSLNHIRSGHKLGEPGVKTRPDANGKNLEILLPEYLPGYISEIATNTEKQLGQLPADSSYRVRLYRAPDNFFSQITVVTMGTDRTSIHKPQICLPGQGWIIDEAASRQEDIPMDRPFPYILRVNKLVSTLTVSEQGRPVTYRSLFVYWYVDADHLTADVNQWMLWWLPRDLLMRGVLERWSYISYFTACPPGKEDAAFSRLKQFIAESVPEYQLVPSAKGKLAETSH